MSFLSHSEKIVKQKNKCANIEISEKFIFTFGNA